MSDTRRDTAHRAATPGHADYTFTLAATAFAALYGLFVLARLWTTSSASGAEVLDGTMGVGNDTRVIIAVCLAFATAFLWLWRGTTGKVLALLSYGGVHVQFGQWFTATAQVKSNTGREVIPQSGSLGNWLLGAGWFDLFALLAVVALTGYGLHFLRLSLRGETRREASATNFNTHPRT